MRYETMTRKGIFGPTFDAQSDEEATTMAEAQGLEVLDITDGVNHCTDADLIIVVEG